MTCPVWLDLIERRDTVGQLRHVERLLFEAAETAHGSDMREIVEGLSNKVAQRRKMIERTTSRP
jgi:hypothetical protein